MRRKTQSLVLSLFASAILSAPLLAEEAGDIKMRCEAEATDAGISDADEKAEYVSECIADLSQGQSSGSSND